MSTGREAEYIPQEKLKPFSAEMGSSRYMCCNLCHKLDRCVIVKYPNTSYFWGGNVHRTLAAEKRELWMCQPCARRFASMIIEALAKDPDALKIRHDGLDGDV